MFLLDGLTVAWDFSLNCVASDFVVHFHWLSPNFAYLCSSSDPEDEVSTRQLPCRFNCGSSFHVCVEGKRKWQQTVHWARYDFLTASTEFALAISKIVFVVCIDKLNSKLMFLPKEIKFACLCSSLDVQEKSSIKLSSRLLQYICFCIKR